MKTKKTFVFNEQLNYEKLLAKFYLTAVKTNNFINLIRQLEKEKNNRSDEIGLNVHFE